MLLFSIFVAVQFFSVLVAQDRNFVEDYFLHKKIKILVGFSCDNIADDVNFIKRMNKRGIRMSIKGPGSNYKIVDFLAYDSSRLGVFLDLRCYDHNAVEIFYQSSIERMYDYAYNWLILAPNLTYPVSILNDTAFNFETDLAIAVQFGRIVEMYDVYNPCKYRGGVMNVTLYGTWSMKNKLHIILKDSFIVRRRNFHGMKLYLGGLVGNRQDDVSSLEYLLGEKGGHLDGISKFGYILLSHVLDMFNITTVLTEYTRWERSDKHGPMIRNLKNLKIDFAFNPLIPTTERISMTSIILPAWPLRTCFLFRTLPFTDLRVDKIFRPLALQSWYMVCVCSAIAVVIFSFILKIERKRVPEDQEHYGDPVLVVFGSLCQQGVSSTSEQNASRIAFLSISVFGLLVYNYYGAAIVSARSHEPFDKLNDSLYTLVDSKLTLGSAKSLFFDFLLKNPDDDVQYFSKRWYSIPDEGKFFMLDEGIKRASFGNFAYHADPNDAYPILERYFDERMICQLTEIHLLRPIIAAYFTNKNEQFHEIAKIGLLRIFSNGLRHRQLTRYTARQPFCNRDLLDIEPIPLYEASPMFSFLFAGFASSSVILIFELFVFHSDQVRRQIWKIFARCCRIIRRRHMKKKVSLRRLLK